jgi:hypothetical protein
MKIALFLLLLSFSSSKAPPADYPLDAQVQSSSLITVCSNEANGVASCGYSQHLAVVIDGKHYEVNGTAYSADLLSTGTYKARIQHDDTHGVSYLHTRIYRFLFPDGKTADYFVVAENQ